MRLVFYFFFSRRLYVFYFPRESNVRVSLDLIATRPLGRCLLLFNLRAFHGGEGLRVVSRDGSRIRSFFYSSVEVYYAWRARVRFSLVGEDFFRRVRKEVSASGVVRRGARSSLTGLLRG